MKEHAIAWFEIATADFERAIKFYEDIFQFKMNRMPLGQGPRMAAFPVNPAVGVSGALCHHPEWYKPSQTGTLVYLNANPDLAAVKAVLPKTQISPEYGYMAVFLDTEGNRVALHSSP